MNDIRVKTFHSSSNLSVLQDAINDDLKRERISEILSVDAFTTGINNDSLVVVLSYRESKESSRTSFKCIIDYYDESDDWFMASNYCVPPKCISAGPRKEAVVIIAFVKYH